MKGIITVVGKDKVGIISNVSSVLAENNVNIMDISQTILQDYFTMIMLVDLKDSSIDISDLQKKMDQVGKQMNLSIKVQHQDIFKSMHRL
ncbi:MAG: ACT domain-containing protein [Clostridia bacterium]|nr:ACT domain-containing protein [Clostridia bacterium]